MDGVDGLLVSSEYRTGLTALREPHRASYFATPKTPSRPVAVRRRLISISRVTPASFASR